MSSIMSRCIVETSREYRECRFSRIEFLEISIPKNQTLTVSQIIVNSPLSHKHTPFLQATSLSATPVRNERDFANGL